MNANEHFRTGRDADTVRRRQRVQNAITNARAAGADLTTSGIARRARVNRSFLYRHPDLLAELHLAQREPDPVGDNQTPASHASLAADLANALDRARRLRDRVHHLETKLSQVLGEQVWRESGLGVPTDIEQTQRRVTQLEQQVIDSLKPSTTVNTTSTQLGPRTANSWLSSTPEQHDQLTKGHHHAAPGQSNLFPLKALTLGDPG